MKVVNFSEFRNRLAENLNAVNDDGDIVVVSRRKGKSVVVMSIDAYNAMQETFYLNSSSVNQRRLEEAIEEMQKGKSFKHDLIEP